MTKYKTASDALKMMDKQNSLASRGIKSRGNKTERLTPVPRGSVMVAKEVQT